MFDLPDKIGPPIDSSLEPFPPDWVVVVTAYVVAVAPETAVVATVVDVVTSLMAASSP